MGLDARTLSKMPPHERIKKLKEIEKQRQKDIKEAEQLIKASIEEIQTEEAVKKQEAERPPAQPFKILEESGLEQTLQKAKPEEFADEEQLRRQQRYVVERYNELRDMRESGNLYDNPDRAFEIYRQIMQAAKYQAQNETVAKIAMGSSRLMEEALGEERSKARYFP